MHEISVNLPEKSTAILPDDRIVHNGHPTGMDLAATLLANIEVRLKALGMNPDEASRLARAPDAIRNLKRKIEDGRKGTMTVQTLFDLAEVLKTTPNDLLAPIKPPPVEPADAPQLREFLLEQRAMIDRQIEALDTQISQQKHRRGKKR